MAQTIDLQALDVLVAKMRDLGIRHLRQGDLEIELGPNGAASPLQASVEKLLDNTRRSENLGLTEAEQDALFNGVIDPIGKKT